MDGAVWPDRFPRVVPDERHAVTPLTPAALTQMVEQYHDQAEEGHHRLRDDVNKLDARFSTLAATVAEMRLSLLQASRPDITNLRMSPATVLTIIMFLISLGGGYLTLRDSINELRKGQQLQELKLNELQNSVLDALRRTK